MAPAPSTTQTAAPSPSRTEVAPTPSMIGVRSPARMDYAASMRLTAALLAELGVTRVARLTGLDRAGIPVATAVRPRGHVLQVCNGKGATIEDAERGAVLEAAELWAAERVDPAGLRFGSLRELRTAGVEAWDPADLGSAGEAVAPELAGPDVCLAWRAARELFTQREVWVPACAVHCASAEAGLAGPRTCALDQQRHGRPFQGLRNGIAG